MTKVAQACADCLEDAGGRQRVHGIVWGVGRCGCCGHTRGVTEPKNFGSPKLQPIELQLPEPAQELVE